MDEVNERAMVLAGLRRAGITATEEEVDAIAAAAETVRQATDALYSVSGVRYADPAMTFDPRG